MIQNDSFCQAQHNGLIVSCCWWRYVILCLDIVLYNTRWAIERIFLFKIIPCRRIHYSLQFGKLKRGGYDLMFKEQLNQAAHGQADYICAGTVDLFDKERAYSLNAVCAGFVERFAGAGVCLEYWSGCIDKCHIGFFNKLVAYPFHFTVEADTGENLMGLAV